MGWIAARRILFGDDYLEIGDPVPVEEGRNYGRMESIGEIRWEKDNDPKQPPAQANSPLRKATAPADSVAIPADWRDLPWTPKTKGAPSLRALAASFVEGPIANKDAAVAAIEAEAAKRAGTPDVATPVAIPDGWRDLPEAERFALAGNFTGDMELAGVEDADALIELEVERRKAEADGQSS